MGNLIFNFLSWLLSYMFFVRFPYGLFFLFLFESFFLVLQFSPETALPFDLISTVFPALSANHQLLSFVLVVAFIQKAVHEGVFIVSASFLRLSLSCIWFKQMPSAFYVIA